MAKDNKEEIKFTNNKETLNVKEFMLLESKKQDELIENTINTMYDNNVKINSRMIDKVLSVAFNNKDTEIYLPHKLCVYKEGNKLVFAFRKKNNSALFIIFLLTFLFLGGFATYSGIQYIQASRLNQDTNGDGVADMNIDLDGDGICDINCDTNKDKKPDKNVDYRGNRKPVFNVLLEDGKIFNEINQDTNKDGKCDINCDTDDDGWPDVNIDLDGDGVADINIDSNNDLIPDINVDTNGDGVADINIDTNNDGECDKNCTYVIPGKGGQLDIGDNGVTVDTAALIVVFEDGNNISLNNLYPDDHTNNVTTKVPDIKFTIENTTDKELYYDINWLNVENSFESTNFWFKISSNYNGYNNDWKTAPFTSEKMATRVMIAPKTKQSYTVSFTLHGTGSEQNYDQGKYFKGKISVELIEEDK